MARLWWRLGSTILTLLAIITLVFALIHAIPGDPVDALLGERATPADRAAIATQLGLDKPLATQYADYLKGLISGNWGNSLVTGQPVLQIIAERLPATAWLAWGAMLVAAGLGIPAGILLAVGQYNQRPSARVLDGVLLALVATPTFCIGPLLMMLFAVTLGWLPVSGAQAPFSLVLPSLTLGLGLAAVLARMTAASLAGNLEADYIRTVYAKGGSAARAVCRHALKNAMLPVVVIFFLQLGMVLTGAVLTEAVFGWPGVGNILVESLHGRDYPLMQGCILLIGITYMATQTVADVINYLIDPRTGGTVTP